MNKISNFISLLNSKGIPLPLIRLDGKPSFTGTLAFISFNVALLGPISKVTNIIGEVDTSAATYLFIVALCAHLGILIPEGLSKPKPSEGETVSEEVK